MADPDVRPAATIVLARPATDGVEVLILTRSPDAAFLPGFSVFPGGAIEDADAALATRLFGHPSQAARACALRELYEEAGILLTATGAVAGVPARPFASIAFDPPRASRLTEIARWVAPEFVEVRFDARFFASAAPRGVEPLADGIEIADARWMRPEAVLGAADRGETELFWPTRVMLGALAECADVADVLALRVDQVADPRAPR